MEIEKLFLKRYKLQVEEIEKLLENEYLKIERPLKIKIIKLYLGEMKSVEEVQKSYLNHAVDIKDTIDSSPEDFYFEYDLYSGPNYLKNLVSMNPSLVIDDLVVNSLSKLHSLACDERRLILNSIFLILRNRTFCRSTLRYIFDNVVYIDSYFYRFGILDSIIKYYSVSDKIISKNIDKLSDSKLPGDLLGDRDMFPDQDTQKIAKLQLIYDDKADKSSDNVMVLSNLIWEEVINYFTGDVLSIRSIEQGSSSRDLINSQGALSDVRIRQYFNTKNMLCTDLTEYSIFTEGLAEFKDVSASIVEKACILEVFSTIVKNTGNFFYNRIKQNKMIFGEAHDFPVMINLIEAMAKNFDKFDTLSEELSYILSETKSPRIVKLLEKFSR